MKKYRKPLLWGILTLVAFAAAAGGFLFCKYGKYANDFSKLRSENYDTVFFSMYPIDNYDEADYEYFRGMNIIKSTEVIEDTNIMKSYMDVAVKSGNQIHTAYLGIDPASAKTEDVFQITLENPQISFEIVLAYPRIDYWTAMDQEKCREVWECYREFAGNVLGLENVRVYYFCNEEWLLCNSGNYVDTYGVNEAVSELLMCQTDYLHNNILNVENFHLKFNQAWDLIEKYRIQPMVYPDMSAWDVVFFGDSVIGNYTDSMSVPGVVWGLTNACTYNLGYGGKSAAVSEKTQESLSMIVDCFIQNKIEAIPEGTQVYAGMEQYIQSADSRRNKIFIINYGLNDYFDGLPVSGEDPYDVRSFEGAMRSALTMLQDSYPGAKIVLMTPNLSIEFNAGEGVQSEVGGKLQDYADSVLSLAEELDVEVLDNFRELPIKAETHWEFLEDGTHPNEQGRFLVGNRIAQLISRFAEENKGE